MVLSLFCASVLTDFYGSLNYDSVDTLSFGQKDIKCQKNVEKVV